MVITYILILIIVIIVLTTIITFYRASIQESLFINKMKEESTKSIVVAYCGENIEWINDYPEYLIFIYTKCNNPIPYLNNPNVKVITLKNTGGCDHTYLYHIVNNWDTLTDYVIFTTGNPFGKRKLCYKNIQNENTFFCKGHITYDYIDSNNFKLDNYSPEHSKNKIPFIKSKYKNLEDFIVSNFGTRVMEQYNEFNKAGYYGIFSVSREQIHLNDINVYKKLLQEVDIGNNNEVGHFIERFWMFIMYNKI